MIGHKDTYSKGAVTGGRKAEKESDIGCNYDFSERNRDLKSNRAGIGVFLTYVSQFSKARKRE